MVDLISGVSRVAIVIPFEQRDAVCGMSVTPEAVAPNADFEGTTSSPVGISCSRLQSSGAIREPRRVGKLLLSGTTDCGIFGTLQAEFPQGSRRLGPCIQQKPRQIGTSGS